MSSVRSWVHRWSTVPSFLSIKSILAGAVVLPSRIILVWEPVKCNTLKSLLVLEGYCYPNIFPGVFVPTPTLPTLDETKNNVDKPAPEPE